MTKKVSIGLSAAGVQRLIDEVSDYRTWLKTRTEAFIRRLGERGVEVADASFKSAAYDGKKDVKVDFEKRGDAQGAVVAIGASVLFVEFGTGVHTYPDIHPDAKEKGMIRGEYGKKHGKQVSWGFYGDEPGTNGAVKNTPRGTVIVTKGNPASMSMYNTVRELEMEIAAIAREVYQ